MTELTLTLTLILLTIAVFVFTCRLTKLTKRVDVLEGKQCACEHHFHEYVWGPTLLHYCCKCRFCYMKIAPPDNGVVPGKDN